MHLVYALKMHQNAHNSQNQFQENVLLKFCWEIVHIQCPSSQIEVKFWQNRDFGYEHIFWLKMKDNGVYIVLGYGGCHFVTLEQFEISKVKDSTAL